MCEEVLALLPWSSSKFLQYNCNMNVQGALHALLPFERQRNFELSVNSCIYLHKMILNQVCYLKLCKQLCEFAQQWQIVVFQEVKNEFAYVPVPGLLKNILIGVLNVINLQIPFINVQWMEFFFSLISFIWSRSLINTTDKLSAVGSILTVLQ